MVLKLEDNSRLETFIRIHVDLGRYIQTTMDAASFLRGTGTHKRWRGGEPKHVHVQRNTLRKIFLKKVGYCPPPSPRTPLPMLRHSNGIVRTSTMLHVCFIYGLDFVLYACIIQENSKRTVCLLQTS